MNIWIKTIVTATIIAALVWLLNDEIIPRSTNAGRYAAHFIVEVSQASAANNRSGNDVLGELPAIIKQRITELGYPSIVRTIGRTRVEVVVEEVRDTAELQRVILRNNKIEFMEVYTLDELPGFFNTADQVADKLFSDVGEGPGIYSIISPLVSSESKGGPVYPAAIGALNKKDTAVLSRILCQPALKSTLPADLQFHYGILTDDNILLNTPDDLYLYATRKRHEQPDLGNGDIQNARATLDFENDQPMLVCNFNSAGAEKLLLLTQQNINRYLAVLLDGTVLVAPRIYRPNSTGRTRLRTRFTTNEAGLLASQLRSGLLPVDLAIVTREISGGRRSHRMGKVVLPLIAFLVTGLLSFFIFKRLKNS
ncbi:MAG: hypothetical protein H7Y42_13505 [Chitinophagaceae bacterium]|nr:hypothetical protein [Chitinophagaceae bacterium]